MHPVIQPFIVISHRISFNPHRSCMDEIQKNETSPVLWRNDRAMTQT